MHVEKAISELRRVLRKDGWMVLDVPINPKKESFFCGDDGVEVRTSKCKQHDHVWLFSVNDLLNRLEMGGFHCYQDDSSGREQMAIGGSRTGLFICPAT